MTSSADYNHAVFVHNERAKAGGAACFNAGIGLGVGMIIAYLDGKMNTFTFTLWLIAALVCFSLGDAILRNMRRKI